MNYQKQNQWGHRNLYQRGQIWDRQTKVQGYAEHEACPILLQLLNSHIIEQTKTSWDSYFTALVELGYVLCYEAKLTCQAGNLSAFWKSPNSEKRKCMHSLLSSRL